MAQENLILNVEIEGANKSTNQLVELQAQINILAENKKLINKQLKELDENFKKNAISADEYDRQLSELTEQQVENNIVLKETNKEYRTLEKTTIESAKATDVAEDSIEQMRIQLKQAQADYIKLGKAERDGTKGQALQKSIKEQSDSLKALEKDIGITSRSVGDYGQAVQGITPLLGSFGQSLNMIISDLGNIRGSLAQLPSIFKATSTGVKSSSTALKLFRVALISTGIGAIVVLLGSLIAAFASTQKGMDKITAVTRPLKAVFETLFGVLQDVGLFVMDAIALAIEKPGDAFDSMTETIKKGADFLLRVTLKPLLAEWQLVVAGIEYGILQMRIAWNEWTGDAEEANQLKEELKEVEKEIDEATETIIDAGRAYMEVFEAVGDAALALGDKMAEGWDRGARIDELTKGIEELESIENLTISRLKRQQKAQKEISEDQARTNAERSAAAEEEIRLLEEINKFESDILDKKIERMKLEQENNDTSREDEKELNDLIAEREESAARLSEQRLEVSKRLFQTNKAQEDALKKAQEEAEEKRKAAAEADLEKKKEAIDAEIRLIELKRDFELTNAQLTADEKTQIEIKALEERYKKQKELAELNGDSLTELELQQKIDLQNKKNEIDQRQKEREEAEAEEAKEKQAEKDEAELERVEQQEALKKEVAKKAIESVEQLGQVAFEAENRRIDAQAKREAEILESRLESGLISQEEYEKQREKLDRDTFNRKKRLNLREAVMNGAVAISRAFVDSPFPFPALVNAGLVAVKTGAEIAAISSQTFAEGGFTSNGRGGTPDHTGHIPVGIVHQNEFVASERTLSTPKGIALATQLEGINRNPSLGYFAQGGFTSQQPNFNLADLQGDITNGVANGLQTIEVVNVATETSQVANRVRNIQSRGTI